MIDHVLRSSGIGASEIAQVLGLSPHGDAFSVYAKKLGLVKQPESKPWMKRGKYFEKGVIDWYSDQTGAETEWFDQTIVHPERSWQLCTPDAWVLACGLRGGGVDAKTANFRARDEFGESGSGIVPTHYQLQMHWSMSTTSKPFWDLAAALGMDDLRINRFHFDSEIETVLLEEADRFWRENVLARRPPEIGISETAAQYLKQRFPRNVERLRSATYEEEMLLTSLKDACERYDEVEVAKKKLENQVRLLIGDHDGLLCGPWKVTWKKDADSIGTDWERVAKAIKDSYECTQETFDKFVRRNQAVIREGARKLLKHW